MVLRPALANRQCVTTAPTILRSCRYAPAGGRQTRQIWQLRNESSALHLCCCAWLLSSGSSLQSLISVIFKQCLPRNVAKLMESLLWRASANGAVTNSSLQIDTAVAPGHVAMAYKECPHLSSCWQRMSHQVFAIHLEPVSQETWSNATVREPHGLHTACLDLCSACSVFYKQQQPP